MSGCCSRKKPGGKEGAAEERVDPRQGAEPPGRDRLRVAVEDRRAVRIAEIPSEIVRTAEDVAARARRLAVARREPRVVQELAADAHARWLWIVWQRDDRDLAAGKCRGVDDRDGQIEAREHVEPVARFVEHQARGPAARDRDLVRGARREAVGLELGRREHADRARAESGDIEHRARAVDRDTERRRKAARGCVGRRGLRRRQAVVDVLVQVARAHRPRDRIDHRHAILVQVPARRPLRKRRKCRERGAAADEAGLVARLGVGHEEVAVGGIHSHVEQDRSDVSERHDGCLETCGSSVCLDREDVLIGQRERHERGPIPVRVVLPQA